MIAAIRRWLRTSARPCGVAYVRVPDVGPIRVWYGQVEISDAHLDAICRASESVATGVIS